MTMGINDILFYKFPHADFRKDILLRDRGQGIEIYEWNLLEPKPTKEQLREWGLGLESHHKEMMHKKECELINKPILAQLHDLDLQSIRYLRVKDEKKLEELELMATKLRGQLKK